MTGQTITHTHTQSENALSHSPWIIFIFSSLQKKKTTLNFWKQSNILPNRAVWVLFCFLRACFSSRNEQKGGEKKKSSVPKEREKSHHQSTAGQVFIQKHIIISDYSHANILAGLQEAETIIPLKTSSSNKVGVFLLQICSFVKPNKEQLCRGNWGKSADSRRTILKNAGNICTCACI